jgi:hypothetical protein
MESCKWEVRLGSDKLESPQIFRDFCGFDGWLLLIFPLESEFLLSLPVLLSLGINYCLLRDGTRQGLPE